MLPPSACLHQLSRAFFHFQLACDPLEVSWSLNRGAGIFILPQFVVAALVQDMFLTALFWSALISRCQVGGALLCGVGSFLWHCWAVSLFAALSFSGEEWDAVLWLSFSGEEWEGDPLVVDAWFVSLRCIICCVW